MSFQGFVTPGIVEELYISGNEVIFRNYSVNAFLSLGLTAPVSVKWGVKDNHFFVQTGSGATAKFYIYTLDRAAEGAIYQPGIIPTATLVKTLPLSALNVTVCTATFNYTRDAQIVYIFQHLVQFDPNLPMTVTYEIIDLIHAATAQKVTAFVLNSALLETPNSFNGQGTVLATVTESQAMLDGDLNLLIPFQLAWTSWKPFKSTDSLLSFNQKFVLNNTTSVILTLDQATAPGAADIPTFAYAFNETHTLIVNLEKNTISYSSLPRSLTRQYTKSGRNLGPSYIVQPGSVPNPRPMSRSTLPGVRSIDLLTGTDECLDFAYGNFSSIMGNPALFDVGHIGSQGIAIDDSTLYSTGFQFVPIGETFELVAGVPANYTKGGAGVPAGTIFTWSDQSDNMTQRWRIQTNIVPLTGRRSPGPISGNLLAAVLHVIQKPTHAIAAWVADVQKEGWFLLRGSGLESSISLQAMQANAPTVTLHSVNEKYLLWSIPGVVNRTTLTTGTTVQVGTDITKFTSRSLTLVNPVYLYSQAETNDDEGIEGHFFVDIESTPLPTTDLPVTGSLVKWDMFNPVDDLRHL